MFSKFSCSSKPRTARKVVQIAVPTVEAITKLRKRMSSRPGRDRNQRPHRRDQPAGEHEHDPVAIEPVVRPLDVLPAERQPLAVPADDRPQPVVAERPRGEVPDDVAEHRSGRSGGDGAGKAELALARGDSGDRHDHLRRDRREQRLQEHQEADAEVARLLDQADDPVAHLVSSAVRPSAARSHPRSGPECRCR